MYAQTHTQRYAQAQVTSVDHKRLLLLVLDGGLRFLRQAREGLAAGDMPRFAEALQRAQAIIAELQATLDFDRGATIAPQLQKERQAIAVEIGQRLDDIEREMQRIRRLLPYLLDEEVQTRREARSESWVG